MSPFAPVPRKRARNDFFRSLLASSHQKLHPARRSRVSTISRREFCKVTSTGIAAAGFLSAGTLRLEANPLGLPIGCQTWPVREMIEKDFPGTIKQLAAAGFQSIELCSPVGYADSGFAGLAKYSAA